MNGQMMTVQQEYYTGRDSWTRQVQNCYRNCQGIQNCKFQKNISTVVIVDGANYPDALAFGTAANNE